MLRYAEDIVGTQRYQLTASNPAGSTTTSVAVQIEILEGDTDFDNLDDDWELQFFGNLDRDGSGDADADGESDRAEFEARTDPTSGQSYFGIASIDHTPGGLRITLLGGAPENHIGAEYSPDLLPGSWIELGNFFEVDGAGVFIDSDSTRQMRAGGYYRAFLRLGDQ